MRNYMDKPQAKVRSITTIDYIKLLSLIVLCLISLSAFPNDKAQFNDILAMDKAPKGIVFELIGSEDNTYLPNALKKIEYYKNTLKKKFPDLKIAVVSHGSEQFELTTNNANKNKKSHDLVKRITLDDVPVHICENHASWRGVKAQDFPDYIQTSARGPAQIKQYQNLGYTLIIVH